MRSKRRLGEATANADALLESDPAIEPSLTIASSTPTLAAAASAHRERVWHAASTRRFSDRLAPFWRLDPFGTATTVAAGPHVAGRHGHLGRIDAARSVPQATVRAAEPVAARFAAAPVTNAVTAASNPPDAQLWSINVSGQNTTSITSIHDTNGSLSASPTILYSANSGSNNTSGLLISPDTNNSVPLSSVNLLTFDTAHDRFFFGALNPNGTNGNGNYYTDVFSGSISKLEAGQQQTLTEVFHETTAAGDSYGITGLSYNEATNSLIFADGLKIYSADASGSNLRTLYNSFTSTDGEVPENLAIDYGRHELYFTYASSDGTFNEVYKAALGVNNQPTSLSPQELFDFNAGGLPTRGIIGDYPYGDYAGIDPTTGYMYFYAHDAPNTSPYYSYIYRIDPNAGNPLSTLTTLYKGSGIAVRDLKIDPATGKYYFVGTTVVNGSPQYATYSGSLTDTMGTLVKGPDFATVGAVAAGGVGYAIDNAPVAAVTAAGATYTETAGTNSPEGTPVAPISNATITDTDNILQASGSVAITGGFLSGDSLQINGTTSGAVGTISYSYDATTGVMSLSGVDTLAGYQSALQAVRYTNAGDNPTSYGTDTTRTLSYVVGDGLEASTAGGAAPVTATVTVVDTNDAPVLGGGGNTASYTSGTPAVVDTGLTAMDPDSANLASATVTITDGKLGDELGIGGTTSGTISTGSGTISYSFAGATLSLSGTASVADYQAALRTVTYDSTSPDPTFAGLATSRTISFTADDGSASDAMSNSVNSTVDVMACYAAGTMIRTSHGDVAVERLAVGDLVVTASGALRPIRWLGHRSVGCLRHRKPDEVYPIRIAAHAFAPDRPARDLLVSPAHAICVDVIGEVLVPAASLVNGATIVQLEVEQITYWHIELDSHDVILAENLPAESYVDCGNRHIFVESALTRIAATGPHATGSRSWPSRMSFWKHAPPLMTGMGGGLRQNSYPGGPRSSTGAVGDEIFRAARPPCRGDWRGVVWAKGSIARGDQHVEDRLARGRIP